MYTHTSVLISSRTHQTLYVSSFDKKYVSALGACSQLIAIARTCMNHDAALQEKMLHLLTFSVLVSLGTHHEFQNKSMTSTKVPLYFRLNYIFNLQWGKNNLIADESICMCLNLYATHF